MEDNLLTHDHDMVRESGQSFSTSAIIVGLLLGITLVALTHSTNYLSNDIHDSVEAGAGFEQVQQFEKNVNSAPINKKLGFIAIALIGAYCFVTSSGEAEFQMNPVLLLFGAYFALLCASLAWSVIPQETLRELIRISVYLFVVLSLARRFQPAEVVLVLMVMALVSVMTSCVTSVAVGNFQPWLSNFRLHGTIHTNELSGHAMIVLLAAATFAGGEKHRWWWRALAVSMFMVIVLTKTRGVLAASLFGWMALVFVRCSAYSKLTLVSVGGMLAALLLFIVYLGGNQFQEKIENSLSLGRSEGVTTLSGRLPLWQELLKESRGHRLAGFGYGAFWTTERTEKLFRKLQWYPGHSHSAYIHTLIDLGYLGVTILAGLVLAICCQSLVMARATRDDSYLFVFAFITAGLVHGLTEVSFVYPRALGFFMAAAICILCYKPRESEAVVSEEYPPDQESISYGIAWQGTS